MPAAIARDYDIGVDWFRVLVDLERASVNNTRAADLAHVPRGTLIGWKYGATPKHHEGERLLSVWIEHTGRSRAELPVRKVPMTVAKVLRRHR